MPRSSATVPNVLRAQCGTREVLELIANKWTALVIHTLASGTRRYGELRREIEGISQKMLTQTLRGLERDGLVSRTVHPVVPPRVEYELTPLGKSLKGPLCALCQWAESHLEELHEARRRYADDRRQQGLSR
jgi:DNA-binding HxlR family transcriptional regulator